MPRELLKNKEGNNRELLLTMIKLNEVKDNCKKIS